MNENRLGRIISGSLSHGLEVRLDSFVSMEDLAVGRYVVIEGQKKRYFGMITDVLLGYNDLKLMNETPDVSDPFIAEIMSGTITFGKIQVMPMLTMSGEAISLLEGPQPVKTIPPHFSLVHNATEEDMGKIFGTEDKDHWYVGNPLDMETKVCLNLSEFIKRSNGIFGKSGTGKTFLTRLLLSGIIQNNVAANLIFDMHSEYGWEGTSEGGSKVKGLKQLFSSKVAIFTIDEESTRRRKVSPDFIVEIGYDEIEPDDIALLSKTLNLTQPSIEAVYQLNRKFGSKWLSRTLELQTGEETGELLEKLSIHESTFRNLIRGLEKMRRLKFLVPQARDNSVNRIIDYLGRGISVVLEFGRYRDIAAYILVSNMLTRRIYDRYREMTEKAMAEDSPKPKPVVITIEEAHKFLNTEISNQTIFGIIAREMRKYNVTLLVIDQRPSGIDEEVMSQFGTKAIYLLDNEKDIDSVLTGVSGKNELKIVLSKLDNRQQTLIFGHALPMPVVIKTAEYGSPESYKRFGFHDASELKKRAEQDIKDLW
ncbi:MAG: ATP-binding protein [Chloroflexi bacterium]|nr:ATP-binding protein [Chloroflexota bacterium]